MSRILENFFSRILVVQLDKIFRYILLKLYCLLFNWQIFLLFIDKNKLLTIFNYCEKKADSPSQGQSNW